MSCGAEREGLGWLEISPRKSTGSKRDTFCIILAGGEQSNRELPKNEPLEDKNDLNRDYFHSKAK